MSIVRSGRFRFCKLAYEEVNLVRYACLIIRVEELIVVDNFCELGDGLSTVSGVMAVAVTFITDWGGFLNFTSMTVYAN